MGASNIPDMGIIPVCAVETSSIDWKTEMPMTRGRLQLELLVLIAYPDSLANKQVACEKAHLPVPLVVAVYQQEHYKGNSKGSFHLLDIPH